MTRQPIRAATVVDADGIAAVHAVSWRSAYRGIFKDSTLGPALDGERRAHWSGKLAAMGSDDTVLVADGVGFIAVWAKGDPGFGAYVDNLHVHPERRSAGLGRRLLGGAMRRVAGGGEIVDRGFDEIDGVQVPHSRIAWRDAARLAAECGVVD
ncbi:MAG: GNAT family N-acetyltransferase [Rhodospirillales bacterium]|nr:GNAT family N-acetyltransferase [Rhodospirillales bacterium]